MNDMQNKKSVLSDGKYILIAMILVFAVGGGILYYFWNKEEAIPIPSVSNEITHNKETRGEEIAVAPEEKWETYTTFSSPKADFTFEYPSTWVYSEKTDLYNPNATGWGFYQNSEKTPDNLIFAVISPMTEWVDFCSGRASSSIPNALAKVNTYKTNDPKTYITYEECGYIYWQKGERFSNADDIKDIYQVNLIKFYFSPDFPAENNIAQHIAQSIKIK